MKKKCCKCGKENELGDVEPSRWVCVYCGRINPVTMKEILATIILITLLFLFALWITDTVLWLFGKSSIIPWWN